MTHSITSASINAQKVFKTPRPPIYSNLTCIFIFYYKNIVVILKFLIFAAYSLTNCHIILNEENYATPCIAGDNKQCIRAT